MQRRAQRNLRRERLFRGRLNPLEFYEETEVKQLFQFERIHILRITGDMLELLRHSTGRNCALSPLQQLCIGLRYYATGCMQLSLGAWIKVSQPTICRVIWQVTRALIEVYPEIFAIRDTTKREFYDRYQLPNILGCIDCTHIMIVAPQAHLHPEAYINRKSVYSINVQVICDAGCTFVGRVVAWPGSVHDSRIFKNSRVYNRLLSGELNGILLADNGYGIAPFCLTPFLNPENEEEEHYGPYA